MKTVVLLILIVLVAAERVYNATVEVYYDSLGSAYLNYENQFVNQIMNPEGLELSTGYIKATFDIINHDITLLEYNSLPLQKEEKSEGKHSPMFGVTLSICVFRGADRDNSSKCVKESKVREYVKYVDLGMRLWSGNQVKIVQGDDLYISSQCLVVADYLYNNSLKGDLMNALQAKAAETDELPNVAVRWFLTDNFVGSWLGVAGLGGPSMVANKDSNAWLISKDNIRGEDPNNGRLITLIHEYGHSCGFHHSGTKDISLSGAFYQFSIEDNYLDCGSYMGNCAKWYQTPVLSQYYAVTVKGNPESWYFRELEAGVHKYRIYANDHPYSRYFLGTDEAFHTDDEIIDEIPFKYNCLAIRILVNESFTSKYEEPKNAKGEIMLEYKYLQEGLKGSADFGVRILNRPDGKSNLLDANFDGITNFDDSSIMQGMDYYPADFDKGTLRMRVTKIHKTVLKDTIEEEIVKENKRTFDEPSYAEIEIEAYPNKAPPARQSPPAGLPNIISSPFFYNCEKNEDESGFSCARFTSTKNGWFYFVNEENRNKNYPRFYQIINNKNNFLRGRNAIRSYIGSNADNSNVKICYGDSGSKCITIATTAISYSNVVTKRYYNNANVTRKNKETGEVEDLGKVNFVYGEAYVVPEGGRIYITDMYGNEKDIAIINKDFFEILPLLETDGFTEGAVIMKDKNNEVTYFQNFYFYQQENGNRVAIQFNENGDMKLTPAVMPPNYYTVPTMLYPVIFKKDEWHIYPIINLKETDYVLIDFKGKVPNGLIMTVETEMGEYKRDLGDLGDLNSVSYKLTYMELHNALSSWAEIDRIKFNKDVEIQNIRPIVITAIGNQMGSVAARTETRKFNGYDYTYEAPKVENTYIYIKVNVEIFGKDYSFDTSTTVHTVKKSDIPTHEPTTADPTSPTVKPSTPNPLDDNVSIRYTIPILLIILIFSLLI